MSKVGVSFSIDVTKIDKNKLIKGKKGTYLDCTVFIDLTVADEFGNSGMITQKVGKDEDRGAILGNCKVFWREPTQQQSVASNPPPPQNQPNPVSDDFSDEIPFQEQDNGTKTMNISWLQNMPKFTHADFGSPWSQATRWGVTNHLDEYQDVLYKVDFEYSAGQVFDTQHLNGNVVVK